MTSEQADRPPIAESLLEAMEDWAVNPSGAPGWVRAGVRTLVWEYRQLSK